MPKDKKEEKFNYAVGFYWPEGEGRVGTYTYGRETFFGTMEDARSFREYCQTRPENKTNKREYKIFKLIEIPE
jgi:hypothetical protein